VTSSPDSGPSSAAVQPFPADRPVRVGIIGLSADGGWAARAHVPALRALRAYRQGYELRALAASSAARAAAAAQVHDVPLAFGTPGELAACDEVDLVVVSVRVPRHDELVRAAIDAGKAVLCEWPLGRDLAEASALAADARARGLRTVAGLQARSAPAVRYVADLVAQGYAGEVLSATLVGSGGSWGDTIPSASARYLIDPAHGATMLTIPFGHTIDGLAAALGEPDVQHATLATRRPMVLDADSGDTVAMTAADQIAVTATLPGGAVLAAHYRGGQFRGTNLRWEINGTEGDLVLQAPSRGHLQMALPAVSGGRGTDRALAPLEVPASYHRVPALDDDRAGPAYNVAHAYAQLLDDLAEGSSLVPDFGHAVRRHQTLQSILDAAGQPWDARGA
jgi:predicted dehydrogenase